MTEPAKKKWRDLSSGVLDAIQMKTTGSIVKWLIGLVPVMAIIMTGTLYVASRPTRSEVRVMIQRERQHCDARTEYLREQITDLKRRQEADLAQCKERITDLRRSIERRKHR